jgi:hypothetical protein
MTITVNIHEAKTHLSRLLERVRMDDPFRSEVLATWQAQ